MFDGRQLYYGIKVVDNEGEKFIGSMQVRLLRTL